MRGKLWILAAAAGLALATGCGDEGPILTTPPTSTTQSAPPSAGSNPGSTQGSSTEPDGDTTANGSSDADAAPQGAQPPVQAAGSCNTGWNTKPDHEDGQTSHTVYNSRIGQHDCYDRVVFDINGPGPVGFDVEYVPVVTEDGSGNPMPVAGDAALQVIIRTPTQGSAGDESGHQPGVVFAPSGQYLHGPGGLEGWKSLRGVRSAGSFEGQSTFAVGVSGKLPFRALSWTDGNQITHVIIDIQH